MVDLEQVVIYNLPKEREKEVRKMFVDKYTRYLNVGFEKGTARRMANVIVYDFYYNEIQRGIKHR